MPLLRVPAATGPLCFLISTSRALKMATFFSISGAPNLRYLAVGSMGKMIVRFSLIQHETSDLDEVNREKQKIFIFFDATSRTSPFVSALPDGILLRRTGLSAVGSRRLAKIRGGSIRMKRPPPAVLREFATAFCYFGIGGTEGAATRARGTSEAAPCHPTRRLPATLQVDHPRPGAVPTTSWNLADPSRGPHDDPRNRPSAPPPQALTHPRPQDARKPVPGTHRRGGPDPGH